MHTPEEQSTVRPLSHCQKETFGPPGDGEGSWGGFFGFTVSGSGRTSVLPLIAPTSGEGFGSTGAWSTVVFRIMFAERTEGPAMTGNDCATAKPMGEQAINTKSRLTRHTIDLTFHLP